MLEWKLYSYAFKSFLTFGKQLFVDIKFKKISIRRTKLFHTIKNLSVSDWKMWEGF